MRKIKVSPAGKRTKRTPIAKVLKKGDVLYPKNRLWVLVDQKGRMVLRQTGDPLVLSKRIDATDEAAYRQRQNVQYRVARLSDFTLEIV